MPLLSPSFTPSLLDSLLPMPPPKVEIHLITHSVLVKHITLYYFLSLSLSLCRELFQLFCSVLRVKEEGTSSSLRPRCNGNVDDVALMTVWLLDVLQRSCSNCGMSLCSRCCSYKVFKSSMGATGQTTITYITTASLPPTAFALIYFIMAAITYQSADISSSGVKTISRYLTLFLFFSLSLFLSPAPEAQRETVFVCVQCNSYLNAK